MIFRSKFQTFLYHIRRLRIILIQTHCGGILVHFVDDIPSDAEVVEVAPDFETFQPDLMAFEKAINEKTKAVIVNTPNNPTGVIYHEETMKKMAEILEKKEKEIGFNK